MIPGIDRMALLLHPEIMINFITIEVASAMLGTNRNVIEKWITQRRIRVRRANGTVKIYAEEFNQLRSRIAEWMKKEEYDERISVRELELFWDEVKNDNLTKL